MRKMVVTFLLMIISIVTCTAANFAIQPYPVDFDQVPLSQTVLAGANVSFSCSTAIVDEQTQPQFIWYHDNTEITNGDISYTGINMSTLFISNATQMDQGEYHCVVKDWETRTKSESGKLTVYSHDTSVTEHQHLNVTITETLVLQCNFDGIESGMIQWFRNGNSINLLSKKFYQLQDGSLVVLHVNSSDGGEYSCEATLNGGHIKLLSYEILTTQVTMDTKQINEAVMLYPENSTRFIANMIIVCKIPSSLLEVYNVMWTRNGTAVSLATEDIEVVEPRLLKIRDMNPPSNEYRCVVFKDSSDVSPTVSPPLIIYKNSVPVVEHSNTTDYYICANLNNTDFSCVNGSVQTVNLYCNSVGGIPIPIVTWYHNGAEIIDANVLNGTLILNKSACDLLGTYQCVVSNEVGSRIRVFRVLPFGWPNAPDMPKLSTKGRILYVNWEIPVYLGGLNSSLISFEPYNTNKVYRKPYNLNEIRGYDCNSVDNQCNRIVSYHNLRTGIEEFYYVNLIVKKSANGICQRYNTPNRIKSMESSINFASIIKYGLPKVNLNCSDDEGNAIMTSEPTGSLSSTELVNEGFVNKCEVNWTCTNATGNDYHKYAEGCNQFIKVPRRSHNCSVDVVYKYNGENESIVVMPKVSEYCLISYNYTQEPSSTITLTENTDTKSQSESAPLTQATFSTTKTISPFTTSQATSTSSLLLISGSIKTTSPFTTSQATPTLSSLLISGSSSVDTFTSLSVTVTANQATPTLSPPSIRNGYGTSLVDSRFTIVAITLSAIVLVVMVFIIIIGIFCCKIRKEQIYKFNMTERGMHCSLDSIPKAYSYIGREDQSTCEKPNQNVASWINSLDDSEEITSINSDDLSNEQMLDALYGVTKSKQATDEKATNAKQGSTLIIEDEVSTVSTSTLLTDYMHKFVTRVSPDIPTTSTLPVVMVEHIFDSQKAPARRNEMQNNASSCSHSLKSSISDNSQMLTEHDMKGQDACQYVSLSNKSKKRSAGTDLSDHGEYIEYDDIARKGTKS